MTSRGRSLMQGLVGLTLLILTGCLKEQKTNSLHVDPAGRVSWMVVQQDVRSDEKSYAAREAEEQEFLALARAGQNPVAKAMRRLDALDVKVQVIRSVRPFLVVTTGRFDSLEAVFRAMLEQLGMTGSSTLESTGAGSRWTLTLSLPPDLFQETGTREEEADKALDPLFDAELRIVLEQGRFTDATGFKIDDDGRVATLIDPDSAALEAGQPIVYSLTWSVQ